MFGLALVVISIGIADSLNPSTIAPALLLATGPGASARIASFTAGVFLVSSVVGVLIVAGPGELLLDALPHPSRHARHLGEVIGGAILLAVAAGLWLGRHRVRERISNSRTAGGPGKAFLLGAGIMAVELPTAAPYFGAIAAIVASRASLHVRIVMVLLFNFAFVAPLLAILAVRTIAGERSVGMLSTIDTWLRRRAATLLAGLLALLGVAGIAVGLNGLL